MVQENPSQVFHIEGNVKLRVSPGKDKRSLSQDDLIELSEFIKQNSVAITLETLAIFLAKKHILLPDLVVRSDSVEVVLYSREVSSPEDNADAIMLKGKPVGLFRKFLRFFVRW